MAASLEIYIKKETLETMLKTLNIKGENGVNVTVKIYDEPLKYGQNVKSYVSQTKEQQEANVDKFYVGNGKVYWNDGKITNAPKKEVQQPSQAYSQPDSAPIELQEDDLPF